MEVRGEEGERRCGQREEQTPVTRHVDEGDGEIPIIHLSFRPVGLWIWIDVGVEKNGTWQHTETFK